LIATRSGRRTVRWLAATILLATTVVLQGCGGQSGQATGSTSGGGTSGSDGSWQSLVQKYEGTWADTANSGNSETWNTIELREDHGRVSLIRAGETLFTYEDGRMSMPYSNASYQNEGDGQNHDFVVKMTPDEQLPHDGLRAMWYAVGLPEGLSEWDYGSPEVAFDVHTPDDNKLSIEVARGVIMGTFFEFDGDILSLGDKMYERL
jgi:hypothetical protein